MNTRKSAITVGGRFIVVAGCLLFLIALLASVAILGFNGVNQGIHSLATDAMPGALDSESIKADTNNLRGDYLQHIADSNAARMQQTEQLIATDDALLARDMKSYEDTIFHEDDRENFNKLKPELDAVHRGWERVLPLSRAGRNVEAYELYVAEVKPHLDALVAQAQVIVDWNLRAEDSTVATTTHTGEMSWWLTIWVSLAALLLGVVLAWRMVRSLNQRMMDAIDELSTGAEQIASAAQQVSSSSQLLAQGASQQAASLEETSASTEEINSVSRANTENSRSAAALVLQSQRTFLETNGELEEMLVSMQEINQASGKISRIIKVIDEIAFQTNLLALNAAVEAARAGEAGQGFAVVADEVRALAQRSAQAAKDTASLIEDSMAKSSAGRVKVDRVAAGIRATTEDSSKIKALVEQVSLGSDEQHRGLGQISRAVNQIERLVQTTAANAEEGATAAEELSAQAESLRDVIGSLNALIGGREDNRRRFAARPVALRHAD
ncbi:MAG TPA: methyl-accepting chemotaxis protein [Granulicella sp.]|nr:methyl-accepting chemotaxis protein [Granulicella sp.]